MRRSIWENILWFWGILWRGWWQIVFIIFASIGVYDTATAQFFPDSKLEPIATYIPYLEYWHWWIILLVLIIIALPIGFKKWHNDIVRGIELEQRIVHSDSARRLFAIDVGDCVVGVVPDQDGLQIPELSLMLTLTAYPAQAIKRIVLYLLGDTSEESTGAFMSMPGKTLFQASPMFGMTVRFKLPSRLRKGTYSAQIIVYVDGRVEKEDFEFIY